MEKQAAQGCSHKRMTLPNPILHEVLHPVETCAPSGEAQTLEITAYARAARACQPRWLHLLGSTPWLVSERAVREVARAGAVQVYRRQAAALGLGLLTLLGEYEGEADFAHACVRATLGRWRMLLRGDGVPARKEWRRDPFWAAATTNVVLLLTEVPGYQTEGLLADLGLHLRWLAGTRSQTSWIEAGTVLALAEGALLVREPRLLDHARARLKQLLKRQNKEGWFPERGGADLGRLSLTVDALARLYLHDGWQELATPLSRTVDFMVNFRAPDGSMGGCYNSYGSAFVSPYGLELLAPELPNAALMAQHSRRRCLEAQDARVNRWHDHLVAPLGAAHALAAADATGAPLNVGPERTWVEGVRQFPQAGLAIFERREYFAVVNARKGGALEVVWRDGEARLSDGGVSVVTDGAVRTSGRQDTCRVPTITEHYVLSRGLLRRHKPPGRRRETGLASLVRRGAGWCRRTLRTATSSGGPSGPLSRLPLTGHYQREIVLKEREIVIRDTVSGRTREARVIYQTVDQPGTSMLRDPQVGQVSHRAPLLVEARRQVCITRTYRDGTLISPAKS